MRRRDMLGHHATLRNAIERHVLEAERLHGKHLVSGHLLEGVTRVHVLAPVKEVERVALGEHFVGHLQGGCRFHHALDGKPGNNHEGARAVSKLGVLHFESVGADALYKFFAHDIKSRNLVLAGSLGCAVGHFHIDLRRFLVENLGFRSAGDVGAGGREFNLTISID